MLLYYGRPRRIVAHIAGYGPYDSEDEEELQKGDQSLRDVALMISGISLEVLFKTKIICDFSWPINETTFTQGIIKEGHDLSRLATRSRMRLDKKHLPVLDELTQYILWMGRYPIPKGEPSFVYSKGSILRQEGLWLTYNHVFIVLHRRTWRHIGNWVRANVTALFPADDC